MCTCTSIKGDHAKWGLASFDLDLPHTSHGFHLETAHSNAPLIPELKFLQPSNKQISHTSSVERLAIIQLQMPTLANKIFVQIMSWGFAFDLHIFPPSNLGISTRHILNQVTRRKLVRWVLKGKLVVSRGIIRSINYCP